MALWNVLPLLLTSAGGAEPQAGTPVARHGALRVEQGAVVGRHGRPVSLAGPSLFWSQWMPQFYNRRCIDWIAKDWKAGIVRVAVAVEPNGYLEDPERELRKVETVLEAATANGMYVIVDWHDHKAHEHSDQAVAFFQRVARKYGGTPNLIYEIYNEPVRVPWSQVIKPYSERVVRAIREIDPDNLIVIGTPTWSQDVEVAAADSIQGRNLVYSLHFYAGTHKAWLREKAEKALAAGAALMVTEWGTTLASGDGPVDRASTEEWLAWMRRHNLSWCNWSIADKRESSAMLRPGANPEGGWRGEDLTESGRYVRDLIRNWGY
ncbi:MAG: glycoside hydrolase family 5 protein [Armatimonadetes bacterium]|nr:glycoside hydrolase family 5 protein [Armatimonadota bacterium]